MKKYLIIYYQDKRIFNVGVVPRARDARHARQIAPKSHYTKDCKISAMCVDGFHHPWSWN